MHLTIKAHDSGLGLYLANKPWRFHKHGNDVASLLINEGVTAAHYAGDLTDEELERDFC